MTEYIIFYSLIATLLIFNGKLKSNIIFYFCLLIVFLFSGFRDHVGYDYINYVQLYEFPEIIPEEMEPIFKASIHLLQAFNLHYIYLFALYSLATIIFISLTIRSLSNHPEMSFFLYLIIPSLFLTSFSIIRYTLALSIFFYIVALTIKDSKKNKFLIVILSLASIGFHYTTIVPLLLFFFGKKYLQIKRSLYFYLLFFVFSFILYYISASHLILDNILTGKYSSYADSDESVSLLKIFSISIIYLILAHLIVKKKITQWEILLGNFFLLSILITIIFADFPHVTRLAYMLSVAQIIFVPRLFFETKNIIYKMTIIGFYLSMITITLASDLTLDRFPKLIPYHNTIINPYN